MGIPKNFEEAKRKFGEDDAVNYYILAEYYGKHLSGSQKNEFLEANSIDDMLNVLSVQQLNHLRGLLGANFKNHDKFLISESFSDWFKKAKIEINEDILVKIQNVLPAKIYNLQRKKTNVQKLRGKFLSKVKKFDENLGEYVRWLILMSVDNSIPFIERMYSADKLLRPLDLYSLRKLKDSISKEECVKSIVFSMKRLEPYLYWIATKGIDYDSSELISRLYNSVEIAFICNNETAIHKIFDRERKNLIENIGRLISQKTDIVNSKISKIGTSKTFEDSVIEVADIIGGDDELFLKEAIGEYSKIGVYGDAFNGYLRKAAFFKDLSNKVKSRFSSKELRTFNKRFEQASEYFKRHLTNREYTVYRGMKSDGLKALLDTAQPSIKYTVKNNKLVIDDDLIKQINEKKPTVFDKGMVSTSLNAGVSAESFGGKKEGGIFLKIKVPCGSKALVLDYEMIDNVPDEEEVLLAANTKMKIMSITQNGSNPHSLNEKKRTNSNHYEIDAEIVT